MTPRVILLRWANIVVVGAICAVSLLLVDNLSGPSSQLLIQLFGLPPWLAILVAAFLAICLLCPIVAIAEPAPEHFYPRVFLRYPSIWLSVPIAIGFAWALNTTTQLGRVYPHATWAAASVLLIICIQVAMFAARLHTSLDARQPTRRNKIADQPVEAATRTEARSLFGRRSKPQKPVRKWSYDEVAAWSINELPIQTINDDMFEHRHIAHNIACSLRLTGKNTDNKNTYGLVGEFGSGKSGIIEMIREELRCNGGGKILLCRVSCWGFDEPGAVLEHVLASAIGEMKGTVDCLAFRGLPEAYRRAVSSVHPFFQALFDGFPQERDPSRLLQQLSPVLVALDTQLVIALEDIDRDGTSEGYLQPIQAMLNTIKSDVDRVTFVLSGSSRGIDFVKLCDHIEQVPPLDTRQVTYIFKNLREHLLRQHNDIDPVPGDVRKKFEYEFLPASPFQEMFGGYGVYSRPLAQGLSRLLSTPRVLKHFVRRVIAVWTALHGEVDLDHAILICAIRVAAPQAYEFLLEHIDALRIPKRSRRADESAEYKKSRREFFISEWRKFTENVEWDRDAVNQIICFMIPSAKEVLNVDTGSATEGVQSIAHGEPTDYWRRIQSAIMPLGEVRDQQVLRDIEGWKETRLETGRLVQHLLSGGRYVDVWEYFSRRCSDDMLMSLADQIVDELLQHGGADASGDGDGLIAVWRQISQRGVSRDSAADWIAEKTLAALPVSIRMANDLYYYWTGDELRVSADTRVEIRRGIVEKMTSLYSEENASRLVGAISKEYPWIIRHLVVPPETRNSDVSLLREPSDWAWFAPCLLAAAELSPQTMIPQLAALVGQQRDSGRGRITDINVDFAIAMFGPDLHRLMAMLARTDVALPVEDTAYFHEIRAFAATWLESN